MINYFNFREFNGDYLLTNDLGRYVFVSPKQFYELVTSSTVSDDTLLNKLKLNAFLYDSSVPAFTDMTQHLMRDAKAYVLSPTQLHIFVVTTACNLQCVYCQAQNGVDTLHAVMDKTTAQKAVDIALQSPTNDLQFEFQGGEPLLNFEIIKYIVNYSNEKRQNKRITFSVVSNLTLLTDEMLEFFISNNVSICTSLDGPPVVHDSNRPYRSGDTSYNDVLSAIERVKARGLWLGAILTVTKKSINYPKQIVDAYISLGFDSISLRALTPLGCANAQWERIGYQPSEFLQFYKIAFDYIIEKNLQGIHIAEGISSIFLKKIITGVASNYMELRSPCGAAIGQMAYYHDGSIYTCDEGRMLAEMGNRAFLLGTVDDSYDVLMDNSVCKAVCAASILESLPSCADCIYQPYCGVCPVINYALYSDIYEKTPRNYRCEINRGILNTIFEKLQKEDYKIKEIFRSWIQ